MMGVNLFAKGISPRAMANFPQQVKGVDCFCRFYFLSYGLKIYHE
jgi:hypothetical protein